jgi:DNA-binding Lrp family transcriptional regulator
MLDKLDKKIIAALQEDFPLVPEPYREIAEKLGITEAVLLTRLQKYMQTGKIRKMGAVLRHREVGYSANALGAWVVPQDRWEEVGSIFSQSPDVTHCYVRGAQVGWPYNFYTMIHAHTRQECERLAAVLAQEARLNQYIMLFSTREWKKNSMRYFKESDGDD